MHGVPALLLYSAGHFHHFHFTKEPAALKVSGFPRVRQPGRAGHPELRFPSHSPQGSRQGAWWTVLLADLCPPKIPVLSSQSPVPQNVTLLGDGVFTEVIKLK